jgi:tetratricopeptide (TPR) repeat protein
MKGSNVIPVVGLLASLALGAAAGPAPDSAQSSNTASSSDGHSAQLIAAARALEISGQRDEALADYTEAIESHALDRDVQARALFARGLLLDGMNRLDDAAKDYGAALSLSPKFAAALNNRANVSRRLRRFTEAQHDYRASLAAGNPQSQFPYYGLGQIAEAQGKIVQARGFYAKALAAAPDFGLASQRLAALQILDPIHLHPPEPIARAEKAAELVIVHPPAPKPAAVHLRPPQTTARAEQAAAPMTPELPAPKSAPVHSRPSQGTAREKRPSAVVLRPPLAKPVAVRLHPPEAVPASFDRNSPALKPALDQLGMEAQIQLGAWRTEAEATQGWHRAVTEAAGVLGGYSPHIVAVDLPGAGRYYRLRVATDKSQAKSLCDALKAKGLACIPARD